MRISMRKHKWMRVFYLRNGSEGWILLLGKNKKCRYWRSKPATFRILFCLTENSTQNLKLAAILSCMKTIMTDYYIRQVANSTTIGAFVALFLHVWVANWDRAALQQSISVLPDQEVSPSQTTRDNCHWIQIQSQKSNKQRHPLQMHTTTLQHDMPQVFIPSIYPQYLSPVFIPSIYPKYLFEYEFKVKSLISRSTTL